jgi:hypothetical protein
MPKMTQADFEYFKGYGTEMHSFFESHFMDVVNPDLLLAYYEGVRETESKQITEEENEGPPTRVCLNKFFPATSTLITELYPKNPKWLITPKKDNIESEASAKVIESVLNYYFKKINGKQENQKAILNAWFFGYGCIKQGWNVEYGKSQQEKNLQENQQPPPLSIGQKVKQFMLGMPESNQKQKTIDHGDLNDLDVILSEGPFVQSILPMDIELDHKRPFNDGKIIKHRISKTLDEVMESGLYKDYADEDFNKYFMKNKDSRNITINLNEMWIRQKDGIYIFTYADGWAKPLRWHKWGSYQDKFPFTFLSLTEEPKVTYPVSHVKVGQRGQRQVDFILTKWFEVISKFRNMTYVNENIFSDKKQAKNSIESNRTGGIVYGNKPATQGDIMSMATPAMTKDIFGILPLLQTNLQEILTVTSARQSGSSELDTLGQEQIAEQGNMMRIVGMKGKIEDFIVDQGKKIVSDIQQFATQPMVLKITGLSIKDPMTGQMMQDMWVNFGDGTTDLKDAIQGEYDFSVDFSESLPKDLPVIRKQMVELAQMAMQLEPMFNKQGKSFNAIEFFKDSVKNFETLSNPEKYIEDLAPSPQMNETQDMDYAGAPIPLPSGLNIPSPEMIRSSAQQIPI